MRTSSNGRLIFSKTCQQCHKLFGEGGSIGPDLTGSNRADLDYLLSNLIDPSAEVAQDFRMSLVEDNARGDHRHHRRTHADGLVQTATERIVLSPEDVDGIKDSALSIMPEGQLDTLTKEQARPDRVPVRQGAGSLAALGADASWAEVTRPIKPEPSGVSRGSRAK